ncbi:MULTISPECIES: phosphoadenosine phosphosulfate reductase family protein [unclassified Polaribacter]|uniref:phosphoadenosine phosphosulfate reductase domain-containing protein n=1 Tax=unclassified Polaribacter TaxID=196858 RepID=UPI00052CC94C|nr:MULTISPECIES: phosphoadenosine phosphosulfate reductase family protein [unclassified Polaribacter]KGL59479.1 phosphoadenylyl-sulfate reductase (thioredoxin) [Polaribacter sp. Hel1_33_49]MDG1196083.1 phosphoadenosine phosphosulfate reductase family protein [Polaribacter sp.]MDG2436809.1 phosphoadenosine phosphosulfate reductase family protein [Polaribacter sp.]PKV63959.1 phosphoadenylylsulfate reductase (thioredoxin) [Polaribacter sp. Hel1_33_96]
MNLNLEQINEELKDKSPVEIITWAISLSKNAVITTNFRPYEVAILKAVTDVQKDIKVIWCDTGYNTIETYKHAEEIIKKLRLNIHLYTPKQTVAHRNVVLGVPSIEDPKHAIFTQQVKLEPFSRAMQAHQPDIWFTNLRKGQTAFRNSIDIVSQSKDGIIKVSPFYNWSDEALDTYLGEKNLPNEFVYFDPTKVESNRECGLHI